MWAVEVLARAKGGEALPATAQATVGNAAPSTTLTLTPAAPTAADSLEASVVSSDPDGDTVQATFQWTVNGVPRDLTAPTVPVGELRKGEAWQVCATPSDGETEGEPSCANATVVNQAPSILHRQLRPAAAPPPRPPCGPWRSSTTPTPTPTASTWCGA